MTQPPKGFRDLAGEHPDNPGIAMMAEREAHLSVKPHATSAARRLFSPCSKQRLLEMRDEVFFARHGSENRIISALIFVGTLMFLVAIVELLSRASWITGCMLGLGALALWAWNRQDRNMKALDETMAAIEDEIASRQAAENSDRPAES
jgi:hypothetical protein